MANDIAGCDSIQVSDKPLIVSACDQGYFPLVKGLFLSIIENDPDNRVNLGLLDLGCDNESLDWLRSREVIIKEPDHKILGRLADPEFGVSRAQTCRPFLPQLFPEAGTIAWMDSDMWVQDFAGVHEIISSADRIGDKVFAAPEVHFLYSGANDLDRRRQDIFSLNSTILGSEVAAEMAAIPVFNSGFFATSRNNPLWEAWGQLVSQVYLRGSESIPGSVYHLAEQVAFNRALRLLGSAYAFDPLYNYVCIWSPPYRDSTGKVRLSAPPYTPVGVIHLAGGWRFWGRRYMRANLLYKDGIYLQSQDFLALESASRSVDRYRKTPPTPLP